MQIMFSCLQFIVVMRPSSKLFTILTVTCAWKKSYMVAGFQMEVPTLRVLKL